IGLIYPGMPVNLEVDAFHHARWGFARAEVREIAHDVTMTLQGQPVFIIKCTLIDDSLSLPSGHQGILKKGMTATAHFVLTRRSLFQLIQDRVEDWLPAPKYQQ
ncbi:MAG: secretion protein HlyD, partial [Bacteroidota bacterium]